MKNIFLLPFNSKSKTEMENGGVASYQDRFIHISMKNIINDNCNFLHLSLHYETSI